jgi:hypothetical protein
MNRLKLILLALVVAWLAGCENSLTEAPQQSLDQDMALSNASGLTAAVTGLYNALHSANIAGGNYNVLVEIMADNVVWKGSFTTYADFANRQMTPDNGNTVGWWTDSYVAINMANVILDAVGKINDPTLTAAQKDIWRGECYFVRGVAYLELARVYGKPWNFTPDNSHLAVPLRTKPVASSSDFENLPRATMAAVFTQVEADLQQAVTLLPATRTDKRATRFAALGYLMRMELEKRNYAAVANYAQQIMAGGYSLTASPYGPFQTKFSTESVFEIAFTTADNPGVNAGQHAFYAPTSLAGRGDIIISQSYVDAVNGIITTAQKAAITAAGGTATDQRRTLLLNGLVANSSATIKFFRTTNDDNVLTLRYADVLLSRAEALAEQAANLAAVPAEVFTLVNTVRERAILVTGGTSSKSMIDYSAASFADKQALIDAILLERRVELAFEGDRFYTIHRKGLDMRGLAASDNRITFPIPQPEKDANPLMVQNPGY